MTRIIAALSLALLLTACSSFKLGSVMYCASATACSMKADPFRPIEPMPPASAGPQGATALPVVKAP